MLKRIVLFILVLLCWKSVASQPRDYPVDSLLERSFRLRISHRDSSVSLARHAFLAADRNGDEKHMAAARVMIGNYFRNSRPDTAIIMLRLAATFLDSHPEYKFAGLANWYLGKAYSSLSAYPKASTYFSKALAIFQAQKDPYFIAAVTSDFAILEGKQFNYVKALEYTNQAHEIKIKNGLPADSELNNMAIVYTAMKDFRSARKILWNIAKRRLKDDTVSACYTYNALGGTYTETGELDSAVFYYRKADQHASWNDNGESQLIALANLASVYIRLGRQSEANQQLKKALSLRSTKNPFLNQMIEVELSRLYFSNHKLDSSVLHARKGLSIATRTRSKKYASEMAKVMSDAYEQMHRTDSAFYYFKIYSTYKDSLTSEEGITRYNDLRVQLETSEKEQEIFLLKKQGDIDRANLKLIAVVLTFGISVALLVVFFLIYRSRVNRRQVEAEKQFLQSELDQRQRDLSTLTLQMIHRQNAAQEIEVEIRKLVEEKNEIKFQRVVSLINLGKSLDREWETFNNYFNALHHAFYDKLREREQQLSISELRLCALIKMRLPNREIANLLNIEVGSVKMAKYRLKKKLKLEEIEDLDNFILRI